MPRCKTAALGATANDVEKIIDAMQSKLPRGTFLTMRGQV